jgi:hypothetical protein
MRYTIIKKILFTFNTGIFYVLVGNSNITEDETFLFHQQKEQGFSFELTKPCLFLAFYCFLVASRVM